MAVTIQIRRDTAADWLAANPVLAEGEMGVELDTGKQKLGDGTTVWIDLLYWGRVESVPAVDVTYDNSSSGLAASDAQGALDELDIDIEAVEAKADENAAAIEAITAIGAGRNLLINGDFSVWQRGTDIAGDVFSADRWRNTSGTTNTELVLDPIEGRTAQITADLAGIRYFGQPIELLDAGSLSQITANETYTLSIRGKFPTGKDVGAAITFRDNSASAENASDVLVDTALFTGTGAFETYTLTFTMSAMPNPTNTCLMVFISCDCSAGDVRTFSQVQLERGDTATDFEYVMPADQLARCQRYYCEIGARIIHGAARQRVGAYNFTNTQSGSWSTTMRVVPTTAVVATIAGTFMDSFGVTVTAEGYSGFANILAGSYPQVTGGRYGFDAEL